MGRVRNGLRNRAAWQVFVLTLSGCATAAEPPRLTTTVDAASLTRSTATLDSMGSGKKGAGPADPEDAAAEIGAADAETSPDSGPAAADAQADVQPAELPPMPVPTKPVGFQIALGGGLSDRLAAGLVPPAGGLALVGVTQDSGVGALDGLAARLDPCGNVMWARTFGGEHDDSLAALALAANDGLLLAGRTASTGASDEVLLIRTDALGKALWSRTYGGVDEDAAVAVFQNQATQGPSGWTVLAASRSFGGGSPPQQNALLLQVDAAGALLWSRAPWLNGPTTPTALVAATDGGSLAVGSTSVQGQQQDVWLARMTATGGLQWARTFGGAFEDVATAAVQMPDQGFVITGITRSFGAVQGDLLLLRTAADGKLLWARRSGTSAFDEGRAVWTSPQGLHVAGSTAGSGAGLTDFLLAVFDTSGYPQLVRTFGGGGQDVLTAAAGNGTSGAWLAGWQATASGGSAGWLVALESSGQTQCGSNNPTANLLTPTTLGAGLQTVAPKMTTDPAVQAHLVSMQSLDLVDFGVPACSTTCP